MTFGACENVRLVDSTIMRYGLCNLRVSFYVESNKAIFTPVLCMIFRFPYKALADSLLASLGATGFNLRLMGFLEDPD
ncbi:hypothetical protein VNO77_34271 [Canavalia gladiata]|uniref:Uncharacterized protein n=1 Tax=Canavalia gladiata TaxID=3824 RepID=A0AAN9KG94_CANGL